jgi:uracil phosphoribosyltransferase
VLAGLAVAGHLGYLYGMAVHVLSESSSIVSHFLAELRDHQVQQDRLRFRHNLERLGVLTAYEISRTLPYAQREVVTPLGSLPQQVLAAQPVLVAILRAALPFHAGFLKVFDQADNAFVSTVRRYSTDIDFDIQLEYVSAPELEGRTVILLDSMIATGRSLVRAHEALVRQYGQPMRLLVAGVLASEDGLAYLQRHLPHETEFWVAAVDEELTARSYIVPGMGDAGDLAFGIKGK